MLSWSTSPQALGERGLPDQAAQHEAHNSNALRVGMQCLLEKPHKRIVLASLDVLQTRDFQEGGVSPNSGSLGELSTLGGPLLGNLVLDEELQGSRRKLESTADAPPCCSQSVVDWHCYQAMQELLKTSSKLESAGHTSKPKL